MDDLKKLKAENEKLRRRLAIAQHFGITDKDEVEDFDLAYGSSIELHPDTGEISRIRSRSSNLPLAPEDWKRSVLQGGEGAVGAALLGGQQQRNTAPSEKRRVKIEQLSNSEIRQWRQNRDSCDFVVEG